MAPSRVAWALLLVAAAAAAAVGTAQQCSQVNHTHHASP
jgi:hypothetical protein